MGGRQVKETGVGVTRSIKRKKRDVGTLHFHPFFGMVVIAGRRQKVW